MDRQTSLLTRNPAARGALALLSSLAGAELHTREIARRTGADVHSVHLALAQLLDVGYVRSRRLGDMRLWSVLADDPNVHPLASALRADAPLVGYLRTALAGMPQVRVAFLFGSFAAIRDRPDSDIDLFITGKAEWERISEITQHVERETGRALNVVAWTPRELDHPTPRQRRFLADLLLRPRIFVAGGDPDLESARAAVARALGTGGRPDRTSSRSRPPTA